MDWNVKNGPQSVGLPAYTAQPPPAREAARGGTGKVTGNEPPPDGGGYLSAVPAGNPLLAGLLADPRIMTAVETAAQVGGISHPRPGLRGIAIGLNAIGDHALDPDIPLADVVSAGLASMAARAGADPAVVEEVAKLPPTSDRAELVRSLQRGIAYLERRCESFRDLDEATRIEAFFAGFRAWDPWSHTVRATQATGSTRDSDGTGLSLSADDAGNVRVLLLEEQSPAYASGLRQGDQLRAVDGETFNDDNRVNLMRRAVFVGVGASAELSIVRAGEPMRIVLAGAKWTPRSFVTRRLADGSTLVRVQSFRPQTVSALSEEFATNPPERLILDLRTNRGGDVDAAQALIDMFATHASLVFESRRGAWSSVFTPGDACESVPLIILIGELSASSSELVAGTLASEGRALLIGTRSLGKGVGQDAFPLTPGIRLYFTDSRARIAGVPYHELGITPALCVDEEGEDLDALVARAEKGDPLLPEGFAEARRRAETEEDVRDTVRMVCESDGARWFSEEPIALAQRFFANPIAFANALRQQRRSLVPSDP